MNYELYQETSGFPENIIASEPPKILVEFFVLIFADWSTRAVLDLPRLNPCYAD
jgi:hypothetical protein